MQYDRPVLDSGEMVHLAWPCENGVCLTGMTHAVKGVEEWNHPSLVD